MDLTTVPTSFGARLPDWVAEEVASVPHTLPTVEDRMRLVHRLAERNHREGTGGPFAAAVADASTGVLLSVGVNLVLATNLSSTGQHADRIDRQLAALRDVLRGGPLVRDRAPGHRG